MKRKNLLQAGAIGLSLFGLAGAVPALNAAETRTLATIDDTQDAKAIEVIEASFEAIGGRDLLAEAKFMKQTGTISIPMAGLNGTIESYVKSPNKFLLVISLPGIGEQRSGYNGDIAWSSDVMSGPRILPDDETDAIKDEANLASRLNFKEDHPTIEYQGEVKFDGAKAHKIRLLDKQGDETIEYYSVERKLLVGNEMTAPSQMGPIKTQTFLRDYKELDGIMIATKMVQKVGPQEVVFEIKTTSYDEIDDSVFELPDAIKALAEAQKQDD